MNKPVPSIASNERTIMRCVYLGCDRWTFARWSSAVSRFALADFIYKPSRDSIQSNYSTNSDLLASIWNEMRLQSSVAAESYITPSYYCAIIDLPFYDFDTQTFKFLRHIIECLKIATHDLGFQEGAFDKPQIILCVAESHLPARNWLMALGADLVLARFARIEPVVERLVQGVSRIRV